MSAAILTAIIASCAVFAAGLCALVYWYAFRFEPVNFKISNITINISKNAAVTDKASGAGDDSAGIDDAAGEIDSSQNKNGTYSYMADNSTGGPGKDKSYIYESADTLTDSKHMVGKAEIPDFTILHLSDFHLRKDRKGKKLFEFVRSLSSCNPDFIFITGDLVEKDMYFDYLIEMLKDLSAKAGKYAVFGVHDYYNKTPAEFLKNMIKRKKEYRQKNDVSGLISRLDAIGIKVLRNERVAHLLSQDFSINITGLEDFIIDKTDVAKAFGKYGNEDQIEEVPQNKHNLKEEQTIDRGLFVQEEKGYHDLNNTHKIEICLTHTPDLDLFSRLSENGVDIVLSGHTHGGQVRLPGIGAIISGCNMKAKYASGLFYFKKFVLYVSRGLGEGRYSPFRFYCPPEATVIKVCFK